MPTYTGSGIPFFDVAFGVDGQLASVPDAVQSNGSMSYTQGFTTPYELAPTNPAYLPVPLNQTNQLFNDVTTLLQYMGGGNAPPFVTTTMNGGVNPYSYNLGAMVSYNAGSGTQNWISTAASNTTTPGADGAFWIPLGSTSSVQIQAGIFSNLKGVWVSNTTATWTANSITIGALTPLSSYSKTLNMAVSGLGGLDTGSIAASTWYAVYATFNTTSAAQNIIASASFSAPTLAGPYLTTLVGAILTDGNSHIIGFVQHDADFQFTTPLLVTSGAQGTWSNTGALTPISISVSTFTAPNAATFKGYHQGAYNGGSSSYALCGPNNGFGTNEGTSPPYPACIDGAVSISGRTLFEFQLESSNIYYVSSASGAALWAYGFRINF
jgi:hypothetical protein